MLASREVCRVPYREVTFQYCDGVRLRANESGERLTYLHPLHDPLLEIKLDVRVRGENMESIEECI